MRTPGRRAGFTLIEMLAVVAIFALLASFVAPNLGVLSSRHLAQQADLLSGQLELARQRAIATGIPHRLAIDLDDRSYWLEWFVSEAEAFGEPEPAPEPLDLRATATIPLAPPRDAARDFRPLPGMFGRVTRLEDSLRFVSVATPDGESERGGAWVRFETDGTATPGEIVLADEGDNALLLEVLPLAEAVRIHDVEL
jgi:type II secretion system protein H